MVWPQLKSTACLPEGGLEPPQDITPTSTSSLRVYQFHHPDYWFGSFESPCFNCQVLVYFKKLECADSTHITKP